MTMTITDLWTAIVGALGSIATGGAVVIGLSSWLGKVWAGRVLAETARKHNELFERMRQQHAELLEDVRGRYQKELESHRVRLRKSEFVFEKEFEAACELVKIRRSFRPDFRHPEMDWGDACEEIALEFAEEERVLEEFLRNHSAILEDKVRALIEEAATMASTGKHLVDPQERIPSEARQKADDMMNALEAAEKLAIKRVRAQASDEQP